jgi:hypothetical protein
MRDGDCLLTAEHKPVTVRVSQTPVCGGCPRGWPPCWLGTTMARVLPVVVRRAGRKAFPGRLVLKEPSQARVALQRSGRSFRVPAEAVVVA